MAERQTFPEGFLWGTATAAYQIEGAIRAEGKSESNWDRFSHTPGKIKDGTTGDEACDHYHRWRSDIDLMKWLGLNAYRFSISWPRVMPAGKGPVNEKGLAFYSRLVDALLENGITPLVTVWHGDHPQVLDEAGGWTNRAMIDLYADYAEVLFRRLGDRVANWITLNEPNCFLYQGFGDGRCPPGHNDYRLAYQAIHNALVAHGKAVERLRAVRPSCKAGITISCQWWSPASDDPRDARAARIADLRNDLWLLDSIHLGRYPEEYADYLGDLAPEVRAGDMEAISARRDFLGVNYYSHMIMRAGTLTHDRGGPFTDVVTAEQRSDPSALLKVLHRIKERYGPQPLYITENGIHLKEELGPDGECHDTVRLEYLKGHTGVLARAIAEGIDLRAFCVWSLMDNFEWSAGHAARYGLFFTDYATQKRIPKDSAKWYREFIGTARGGAG